MVNKLTLLGQTVQVADAWGDAELTMLKLMWAGMLSART